jgi:hypothetical protein
VSTPSSRRRCRVPVRLTVGPALAGRRYGLCFGPTDRARFAGVGEREGRRVAATSVCILTPAGRHLAVLSPQPGGAERTRGGHRHVQIMSGVNRVERRLSFLRGPADDGSKVVKTVTRSVTV